MRTLDLGSLFGPLTLAPIQFDRMSRSLWLMKNILDIGVVDGDVVRNPVFVTLQRYGLAQLDDAFPPVHETCEAEA